MQVKSIVSASLIAFVALGSVAVSSVDARDNQFNDWRQQQKQYKKDLKRFAKQQRRAFDRIDNRYFDDRWHPDRKFSLNPFTWW